MDFKSARFLLLASACIMLLVAPLPARGAVKWVGQIPKVAENTEHWQRLMNELMAREMHYGALSGAQTVLNLFSDLPAKENAFATIIRLVDIGYPYSTRSIFVPGDIEPASEAPYRQSYFLYKGIVNLDKKMTKWAENYFAKIDRENFPKYLFFTATQQYREKKLPEAVVTLQKVLSLAAIPGDDSLARKAARTLARVYYETGDYEKSLEIYQTFLLKLNPVTPTDWLEGAWNHFRLKRYAEAVGYLYNLESKAAGPTVALEKYVLRALIYREHCSVEATDALIASFEKEFGSVITAIKTGEPLNSLLMLEQYDHPATQEYRQYGQTIEELNKEVKKVSELPGDLQPLANYLYAAELASLARNKKLLEEQALVAAAKQLTILDESLKFLKFDVARERFNPDRVFADKKQPTTKLVETTDEAGFRLRWLQRGDYWIDERLNYKGFLADQCDL